LILEGSGGGLLRYDRRPLARGQDYHWHVVPGSELLRDRVSRPYSEITHHPGLAPVRPTYLHITIQHLAAVSQVTDGELGQIVEMVRDRCAAFAPFAVTAGRAEAWEHGIVQTSQQHRVLETTSLR
jgi:2'-5' RNA ligase